MFFPINKASHIVLLFVVIVISISGCKTTEQALIEDGWRKLSGKEISNFLTDKTTYTYVEKTGKREIEYHSPSGFSYYKDRDSEIKKSKWWIDGDIVCYDYVVDGKSCWRVFARGEIYKNVLTKKPYSTIIDKHLPGNVENFKIY
jgi:hypothetical protein